LPKLTKQEYLIKAAKLYGLSEVEIEGLENHLNGTMPNDYIMRRCDSLVRLYKIYDSKKYNEHIDPDEDGIINLNDYAFEISRRRLADSKIGKFWILSSNLDSYLATVPANMSTQIKSEYLNISEKNNFLIPQLAKQIGIDATIYYKGEYTNEHGTFENLHLTKNFLQGKEKLIRGKAFCKGNPNRLLLDFEKILETTDKYIKKHYKKYKLPNEDLEKARIEIREGLIKQTLFNKIVFNENESNEKWGLIQGEDNRLRLAPLFSYDFCANVQTIGKTQHRVVQGNKEYIEDFTLQYSKEPWFKSWIDNAVVSLDLGKAIEDMERKTGVTLTDNEKEYYNFAIMEKMHSKVVNVSDLNYDKELVVQEKKKNLTIKDRFDMARKIVHDRKSDISYFVKNIKKDRDER
jgi:hypothetical protein